MLDLPFLAYFIGLFKLPTACLGTIAGCSSVITTELVDFNLHLIVLFIGMWFMCDVDNINEVPVSRMFNVVIINVV